MNEYRLIRIGDLARRAKVSVRTIHYYEEMNLLQPVARTDTGYRLYDKTAIQRLETVKRMKLLGLKLDEIRFLMETYEEKGICGPVRQHLRELLQSHIQKIEGQIAELNRLKLNLEMYLDQTNEHLRVNTATQVEQRCQNTLGVPTGANIRRKNR